jgi:hypothetical protein
MSSPLFIHFPRFHVAVSPVGSFLLHPVSLFHRLWRVAGISAGLIATATWIAFLVYGLLRLVF